MGDSAFTLVFLIFFHNASKLSFKCGQELVHQAFSELWMAIKTSLNRNTGEAYSRRVFKPRVAVVRKLEENNKNISRTVTVSFARWCCRPFACVHHRMF